METLDELVLNAIEARILEPKRLKELLRSVVERTLQRRHSEQGREKSLAQEMRQVETRVRTLLGHLGDGLVTDTDLFRAEMNKHYQRRDELTRLIGQSRRRRDLPTDLLSPRRLDAFRAHCGRG